MLDSVKDALTKEIDVKEILNKEIDVKEILTKEIHVKEFLEMEIELTKLKQLLATPEMVQKIKNTGTKETALHRKERTKNKALELMKELDNEVYAVQEEVTDG